MKFKIGRILAFCIFLGGCSSAPPKAELESSDPKIVISSIQKLKKDLIEVNTDVLAKKSFNKGERELAEGIESSDKNESTKETLEKLAQSKAYFLQAQEVAKKRNYIPQNIMDARTKTTNSKIFANQSLRNKISNTDDELINETDTFTKQLSTERISDFQSKYQQLEIQSVQNAQLGVFRKIISNAEDNNAKKLAPKTLAKAKNDVYYSSNLISQYSRDPFQYKDSVEEANKSVKLLDDVMNKLKNEAKGSSEKTALTLVYQERKLGLLSTRVDSLQSSLAVSNEVMDEMHKDLESQQGEISKSRDQMKFQKTMDTVRKSFNDKEASVYQQGDNLIIRLRKINFKSGDSAIPTSSIALLSKVNSVIGKLNPDEVMIEGHTDSTGNQSSNMMLSDKRAKAVKEYLSSLDVKYQVDSRGFGESKPIADNSTKMGRSLNRRVDIVVKANQ